MNAPPPFGYYAPPETAGGTSPPVIILYRLYAALMALFYGAIVTLMVSAERSSKESVGMDVIYFFFLIFGGLCALHALAAFVPRRPWGWTLGVLTLGVGVMSFGIALAIPLLVFWLRPGCKAAFRRFL